MKRLYLCIANLLEETKNENIINNRSDLGVFSSDEEAVGKFLSAIKKGLKSNERILNWDVTRVPKNDVLEYIEKLDFSEAELKFIQNVIDERKVS